MLLNLNFIDKKTKPFSNLDADNFWEEIKRVRQLMKNADAANRKSYWRFLEKYLYFLKENLPEAFETVTLYIGQAPESDASFREKSISYMMQGMISESFNNLKKHLKSEYWKDDERVWIENQFTLKLSSLMGIFIKASEDEIKEEFNYFAL